MTEFNYSLCLALENLSGNAVFYRIADYHPEKREFVQAYFNRTNEMPLTIHSPKIEGQNNKVEIRKWYENEEEVLWSIQESLKYGYIYEVVFVNQLIHQPVGDNQLRQILYDGINLPKGIQRYFLIALDVNSDSYKALLCDKEAFVYKDGKYYIEKQVKKIDDVITHFKILYIYNDQLISTESAKHMLRWYNEDTRYFYNSILLPEHSDTFQLRNPEDYMIGFFMNYLKDSETSGTHSGETITRVIKELEISDKNYELINRFFITHNIDEENAHLIFTKKINKIIDSIRSTSEYEQILFTNILENDGQLRLKMEEEIELRWMSEYNENILNKEQELDLVQNKLNEKSAEFTNLSEEFEQVKIRTLKVTEELKKTTIQKNQIQSDIERELKQFQNNILEQVKLSSIALGGCSTKNNENSALLISEREVSGNVESIKIEDFDQLISTFIYNLENFMINENAIIFALTILSIARSQKLLILAEFQSEELVNAISLVITGHNVNVINVISEDFDLKNLITQVNSNHPGYTLIRGHLDLFNETAITTLINQSKHKNIVFSINDEKSLSLFSNNFWNYFVYLNPTEFFDFQEEFRWKKNINDSIELNELKLEYADIPRSFEKYFMEEVVFTPYIQEDLLFIVRMYTHLYQKYIDTNYKFSSLKGNPLKRQLLMVNQYRIEGLEKYYNNIGIDSNYLKLFK